MPAAGPIPSLSRRRHWRSWLFGACLGLGVAIAAETRPVVGVGATREAVLDAYGWPSGQSQSGGKEIFTYPQGQVILQEGVVERMEFSPNMAWPKPKPRPGTTLNAKGQAAPVAPVVVDAWLTDFTDASREARARPAHILALFTGTDWSPPCQRFQKEVGASPAFVSTVGVEFVLLRLDFPTHAKQAPELRLQNSLLRERFEVTTYPTLMILSAEGFELARVDLAKNRPQATYREQVIAAIAEAKPKPAALMSWSEAKQANAPTEGALGVAPAIWRRLNDKIWVIGGTVVVLFASWLLLRRRREERVVPPAPPPPPRGVLPTPADIAAWPQDRVRDVVAALFEFEGSQVAVRPTESGAELALSHPGEAGPRVLVRCQSSSAGLANGKSVRNLLGTVVAERVDKGWYVSPGGFTPEARQFAREQGMVLIGGEELLLRMKSVPPLALIRMLTPSEN